MDNIKSSKKLEVAFLGGSINSAVGRAHYSSINIDSKFKLVAGCFSRNQKINLESAKHYNVKENRIYKNLEELLFKEKDRLDAIIVLTPTDQHFGQVCKIIKAKIPIIVEKALATTYEEIHFIKELLNEKNGFLAVIYNYLGYPMIREFRNYLKDNLLGQLNQVLIEMPMDTYLRIDKDGEKITPQQWRLEDKDIPLISLDLGVHLHMLLYYLTNQKPLEVIAKLNSFGNFSSVVDNINCIIEYSNNLTCNMWFSKSAIGHRNGLKVRIYGEKGSIEWFQEDPENLLFADATGDRWIIDRGSPNLKICNQDRYVRFKAGHPSGFIEAFSNYYFDIAESLNQYKTDHILNLNECFGIEESLEGIKLLKSISKSGKSKIWETVS